jgi:hypothetical protein
LFQKRSTLPPQRKFLLSRGGGEEKLFLIIVSVLGHPKGVGGLTSNFLCGGGMDVFWNDPFIYGVVITTSVEFPPFHSLQQCYHWALLPSFGVYECLSGQTGFIGKLRQLQSVG